MSRDWHEYFKQQGIENFPLFVYHYFAFRPPEINHIKKHVPKGGSIIELGCGSALLSILLSSMEYEVMAIDSDPRIVELARHNNERLGGRARIELMNLFEAPKKMGKVFDLAYSEGVIEHFSGVALKKALRVHAELAKKVMFVVPAHEDPLATDQETYSFKKLERLCRSATLQPIDRFGMGTGLAKWSRRILPPVVLARLLGRLVKCENIVIICTSPKDA